MSRRALSDNRDRPGSGPVAGGTAIAGAADTRFMKRAIALAAQQYPHPNPRVGAVIVDRDGTTVAEAAHERAGAAHAESLALAQASERAGGATIYVTLEPCTHFGRTPPCSRALIDAGIARVVVGAVDPDTRVAGSGIEELRRAGIEVIAGVLSDEVEAMDPGYFHHRRSGLPLVTLKLATTLDGQIAAADRSSKWLTGEQARRDVHMLRSEADVVIVGAGTLIDDDPLLDVRLDGYSGRQPRPVIVAGSRPIPPDASLASRDPLVYTPRSTDIGGEHVIAGDGSRVDIGAMLEDLGGRGYVSALVEGGSRLARSLIDGGHVDRMVLYLAGKLGLGTGVPVFSGVFATLADAVEIEVESVALIGNDIRVEIKVGG